MLEIIVIIFGIVTLIRGKYPMGGGRELVGGRARIIGGILLAYLPVSFGIGVILAVMGEGEVSKGAALAGSIVLLIITIVVAIFVAKALYKKQEAELGGSGPIT